MIVVRLCGGLGNQLFQYAAGRALASINGAELVLDLGWFKNRPESNTPREYELSNYRIQARVASESEERIGKNYSDRFRRRVPFLSRPWTLCREKSFDFDENFLKLQDNIYLDGYWQSYKYFNNFAEALRKELTPIRAPSATDDLVLDSIDAKNSVSVHVRRGDYISQKAASVKHGTCSVEYYQRAVHTIMSRVNNPHFFVFSDDCQWARENLLFPGGATFVDHNGPANAFQDVRLMAHCKHHVIANSTFSWWGAWLNPRRDKIIAAPKNWFANGLSAKDIVPNEWIRL